jgi:hypothetical protein
MKPIMFAAAIASLTTGCVFIPVPHDYVVGSRQNMTEQSTNLIQPGKDTIEKLMLKMGEPDAVSPDERRITYASEKSVGELFIFGLDTDGSDLPNVSSYRFLNIMLDHHGVVTNCFLIKQLSIGVSPDNQMSMFVGSIHGEPIKVSFEALCNPDFNPRAFYGHIMLTDSTLYDFEESQLPHDDPVLSLRYETIKNYWVTNDPFGPSLTISTKDGHNY